MNIQITDSKGTKHMQQRAALRPLVTAGVAAVGASVIALTPAVSNDLAADIQHGAVTFQQRAVELTDYVANPIQTWIDTFDAAAINIQSLAAQYALHPFPVLQQVAANFLQYGVEYVQPYQTAANAAVQYFLGMGPQDFVPLLQTAMTQVEAGQINTAVGTLVNALYTNPIFDVAEKLETIPEILNPITQNLANATKDLTSSAIDNVGFYFAISLPYMINESLGPSLQNVYDSFAAGDPVGGLINAIDVPGEVTNTVLNGLPFDGVYINGLISAGGPALNSGGSLAKALMLEIPQHLAESIVAPGAQNIMTGGSLSYALGYLGNLVTTSFPTPQILFDSLLNLMQTYLLGGFSGAAAATLPAAGSIVGAFNPADVLNGGSAMASLATELPGLSADAANMAGHLGADLASVLPGMILSVLHF
ncbi:hypothetical protein [Mycobacterium malmoense]|uniref:hypothetical protein n=1 Tax=Mycobacterium malmoense TaxID=1780 RepID=UPI0008F88779|nr:hypothetical protein [Mycobacterium malmoense]OIN77972.1 hypothetical protein BMG05_25715 [Mycobacterium malmoense]